MKSYILFYNNGELQNCLRGTFCHCIQYKLQFRNSFIQDAVSYETNSWRTTGVWMCRKAHRQVIAPVNFKKQASFEPTDHFEFKIFLWWSIYNKHPVNELLSSDNTSNSVLRIVQTRGWQRPSWLMFCWSGQIHTLAPTPLTTMLRLTIERGYTIDCLWQ